MDPGLLGEHRGEFPTTPLGMERAVLQGVLIDEAIEMVFQCAGDFGRSTGARAIHQTLGALVGKAVPGLRGRWLAHDVNEQLLESLSRKEVAPIRGYS